jgi:hypothetical protein
MLAGALEGQDLSGTNVDVLGRMVENRLKMSGQDYREDELKDIDALCRKLKELSYPQKLALMNKVEVYFSALANGKKARLPGEAVEYKDIAEGSSTLMPK